MEGVAAGAEHQPMRPLSGAQGRLAFLLSAALAAYALYWVLFIVQPQRYRVSFLLIALVLIFLLFPSRPGALERESRAGIPDWLLAAAAVVSLGWPLVDFDRFVYRAAEPLQIDLVFGCVAVALVLEAARRAVGWILPATAAGFLAYAWAGPVFDRLGLPSLAHRGYGPDRLVGTLYMTLEGMFGVPLDVAATYIVLFTIYGAVLERSGAARFFIDWALSASGRSAAAPGRSVTLGGFLLGTVSGSGVATTVMLGSVAWPVLRRAGYSAENGGAILSAAGIGALLSPPTLGAAAFLIAEFLRISYVQVLVMATLPTLLYYLSILLMIEADARGNATLGEGLHAEGRPALDTGAPGGREPVRRVRLSEGWYHFISLLAIGACLGSGMSAFRAVFWATVLAAALSYVRAETALGPRRLLGVLASGGRDVLAVAATTATAGIIVGVVTLTGLGLKIAGIIVAVAGGSLVLTVACAAAAVWLLGLAIPVTASYIIAAVMVAPALVQIGVPEVAAHMFIFYYAVLSEVSPPTALSPFAAAALTGGNPFRTMVATWRYTLPAFVVPLVFTLAPHGMGVLLQGSAGTIALGATSATAGVGTLAAAVGGWAGGPLVWPLRLALGAAGILLLSGTPIGCIAGGATAGLVLILHTRRAPPRARPADPS